MGIGLTSSDARRIYQMWLEDKKQSEYMRDRIAELESELSQMRSAEASSKFRTGHLEIMLARALSELEHVEPSVAIGLTVAEIKTVLGRKP